MNTSARLDLDVLTLDAVRAGALAGVPATVLGLARTGVALARFLVDAGARVTVYDGKPADALAEAIAGLEGRPVALACGPDADPAAAWAEAALVAFSPSITPGFPTTEPRLRVALDALAARVAAGDPAHEAVKVCRPAQPDVMVAGRRVTDQPGRRARGPGDDPHQLFGRPHRRPAGPGAGGI